MSKRSITEGFKNIIRTFWLSATAISVLVVSVGSVALVAGLRTSVGFSLRQLDKQLSIVAYFEESITEETIQGVKKEIEGMDNVSKVRFVSKEEEKEKLQISEGVSEGFAETLDILGENPLLDSLHITPTSTEEYSNVVTSLSGEKYLNVFDDIQEKQDVIDKLETIYWWTNIVGIGLVIIFSLISILVMINILRISIYSYRSEIEIMRLVGATNRYIQGPFIAQGALFNIIASLIVVILFAPLVSYVLVPKAGEWLSIDTKAELSNLVFGMYLNIFIVIFVSIAVGVVASYFATKKYLKL